MKSRWFPAFLLIFGGGALLLTALLLLLKPANNGPASLSLPSRLAGQPLVVTLSGEAAMDEINELHRKEFDLDTAAVGYYRAGQEIILWISGAESENGARLILAEMREKIAEGCSPFQPVGERRVGDTVLYNLDGLRQRHVYYQTETAVLWLTASPDLVESALSDLLIEYP